MKKILILAAMLIGFNVTSIAQDQKSIPKNFAGVFAGIEWNTASGLIGLSYERSVLIKDKLTVGLKGLHVFNYNYGNIAIFMYSYEGRSSITAILPTIHYSTSKTKTGNDGFFIQFGLGTGVRRNEYREIKYTDAFLCMENAFGWQSRISNKITLTWTNSILFAGHGAITSTGFSLGF